MDMMQLRKMVMGQMAGGLPSAYQQVAYISSTAGTGQYIDTGKEVTDTTIIKAKWQFNASTSWQSAFGGRGTMLCIQRNAATNNLNAQSFGTTATAIYSMTGNELIESEITPTQCKINGNATSLTKGSYNYPGTIWLFAKQNIGGTAIDVKGGCDIYYCQLYDNGVLVRDFIPCVRISDNEPGMYDMVSRTFFTNAGTGSFVIPS